MIEHPYTTTDLAAEFQVSVKTVLRWTKELDLGMKLGRRAGYRYSDKDRARIVERFRQDATPAPRRKRRAA